jgi:hypothetical protein
MVSVGLLLHVRLLIMVGYDGFGNMFAFALSMGLRYVYGWGGLGWTLLYDRVLAGSLVYCRSLMMIGESAWGLAGMGVGIVRVLILTGVAHGV